MQICKKQKKIRPPLKPRQGPYLKTNAYTNKYAIQQVIAFILTILIVILHSIFNVAAIIKINYPILFIMLAFYYMLIIGLVITYVQITNFDPVDTFIINPISSQIHIKKKKAKYCPLCKSYVHIKSYHCKRCKRCTQDFDHHCVYLNNCIGSRNYQIFMRILLFFTLFLLNSIGQSVWVFVAAKNSLQVRNASIFQWVSIVIIVISLGLLIAVILLLGFHFYISCCLDVTTLIFIQSQTHSQTKKDKVSIGDNIQKLDTVPNEDTQSPNVLIRSRTHTSSQILLHSSGILI